MSDLDLGVEELLLSRPDSDKGQLQRACLTKLRQHERDGALPTNGHFVWYELLQDGVLPKHYEDQVRQPKQYVIDALSELRKRGVIPWDWIVDETRELIRWRRAQSVFQYIEDSVEGARINPWGGEPAPLTICEARSTKGVLERTAALYLNDIVATNGQVGGFLHTDIAPALRDDPQRPVLYIGDCELRGPGEQIETNTRRELEKILDCNLNWTRIALTQEQVDVDPRLKGLEIEKLDKRNKPPKLYRAVECEAVGQVALERMLRDALDALLPEPLRDVREREKVERREALRALKRMARNRR